MSGLGSYPGSGLASAWWETAWEYQVLSTVHCPTILGDQAMLLLVVDQSGFSRTTPRPWLQSTIRYAGRQTTGVARCWTRATGLCAWGVSAPLQEVSLTWHGSPGSLSPPQGCQLVARSSDLVQTRQSRWWPCVVCIGDFLPFLHGSCFLGRSTEWMLRRSR